MPRSQETENQGLITTEIEEYFKTKETWQGDLRKRVKKTVRARYKGQIDSDVRSEYEHAERQEKESREQQIYELRRRVWKGESTGNRSRDIYFVSHGEFDEEGENRIEALWGRLEEVWGKEENPLILQTHFRDGEPNYLNLAISSEPNLFLRPVDNQLVKRVLPSDLVISSKKEGHASWSNTIGRTEFVNLPLLIWFHDVKRIELGDSFEEAAALDEESIFSSQVEKGTVFLIGQEEIRAFLCEHKKYELIVLKMTERLLNNTDEMILEMGGFVGQRDKAALVRSTFLPLMRSAGYSEEELRKKEVEINATLQQESKEAAKVTEAAQAWLKVRMVETIGGYLEEERVIWVEDREAEIIRLSKEAENFLSGLVE